MPNPAVPDGLTTEEARRRLAQSGPNAVPDEAPSGWRRAAAKLWAPVPWMLEAAIALQLVVGEYVQAGVIGVLLLFNGAIGFLQESRAQATLDALKSRLALVASVRRDGVWQTVPAAALVPGDIVKLSLGGVVAADMRLIAGSVLLDHSTLTGESLPVEGGPGLETYAGALVRRGEAVAEVTATGARTKFGRTAELVRTAHVVSSQQKAVLHVVRNLAVFNATMVVIQVAYAAILGLPTLEIVPLTLTAILAAIPVALPATFTLATALGAHALARRGVLPTRLSAIDEAATMDVLCADKTGTLTRNALAVTAVRALPGFDEPHVLRLAALASSEGGQDPVDGAIRAAAARAKAADLPRLDKFVPFDPANKMSEAAATDAAGHPLRIVKGAYATIGALAQPAPAAAAEVAALQDAGYRVLAVAAGPSGALQVAGLIALSDPPRADSAALIAELLRMGVHTVMVTGDAPSTAAVVARAVGLDGGAVCPPGKLPDTIRPGDFAVFAGVFPEDKFRIVKAFQACGHTVGMCGDGANDAPALRQAQMGIAVSTATDVAKSAAGIVLTEPGLGGIVAAVREGRVTFQRILTYAMRSFTLKISQMLFLTAGLFVTGHAILTPMLMVILMIAGDLLAMSATTDNVRPSPQPNVWRIGDLTLACIVLGACNLIFCTGILAAGAFRLGLPLATLQTLAAVTLVFSGQAAFYVVRERRWLWSSWPSRWVVLSSIADVTIISALATRGWLMSPLPLSLVGAVLAASVVLAFVLDTVKRFAFARLKIG
ncbi:MAG: HAD-IC family P-type ATPase [Alphaproteobacteria bacterium]|nr:HAD-IC family P-type ATPase [Alphaproteobacteria bacterium]